LEKVERPTTLELSKYGQSLREDMEAEKLVAVNEAVEQLKAQHREEVQELLNRIQMEKQECLTAMRSSLVAEKQVSFNEALKKVVEKKDRYISDLENERTTMLMEREIDRLLLEECWRKHEGETTEAGQKLQQMREDISREVTGSPPSSLLAQTHLAEMQSALKAKEEELIKLQQKMTELSTSGYVQDKVSILSCNVGDVVIICFNERHSNFVVFSVNPTLYFLHNNSLEPLGLGQDVERLNKAYVLAEVTGKEYCQTRKVPNRYNVPMGSKFYRVTAKPWDCEAALKREYEAKKAQASSMCSTSTSTSTSH